MSWTPIVEYKDECSPAAHEFLPIMKSLGEKSPSHFSKIFIPSDCALQN